MAMAMVPTQSPVVGVQSVHSLLIELCYFQRAMRRGSEWAFGRHRGLQQDRSHENNIMDPIPSEQTLIHCETSYFCNLYAFPKVNNPYNANRLNPLGNGFWLLIARGIEEPASTIEARRASSIPYDWRF